MPQKNFTSSGSRLDKFASHKTQNANTGSIAGRKVSQIEEEHIEKVELVKTSIRIPKDLKEKTQALAHLKQVSWTELIEQALENQLRANAQKMNQFTRFHIDDGVPQDGTSGTNGTCGMSGTNGTDEAL